MRAVGQELDAAIGYERMTPVAFKRRRLLALGHLLGVIGAPARIRLTPRDVMAARYKNRRRKRGLVAVSVEPPIPARYPAIHTYRVRVIATGAVEQDVALALPQFRTEGAHLSGKTILIAADKIPPKPAA
jgi:hypothetical protein